MRDVEQIRQRAYDADLLDATNERRARQGRPPRSYNPEVLDVVLSAYSELRRAERTFLQEIDKAKGAGVPLRDLESRTGISRSTLARGPVAHWHSDDPGG